MEKYRIAIHPILLLEKKNKQIKSCSLDQWFIKCTLWDICVSGINHNIVFYH